MIANFHLKMEKNQKSRGLTCCPPTIIPIIDAIMEENASGLLWGPWPKGPPAVVMPGGLGLGLGVLPVEEAVVVVDEGILVVAVGGVVVPGAPPMLIILEEEREIS